MSQERQQNGTETSEKTFSLINGQGKQNYNKTSTHEYGKVSVPAKAGRDLEPQDSQRRTMTSAVPRGEQESWGEESLTPTMLGLTSCFLPVTVRVSP